MRAGDRRVLSAPLILTIVGLGAFVTALDQTVVVTALPSVMVDLKIPPYQIDRAAWIITSYLLGYTVAMPVIGRLADVYGYSRVYQISLVVFAVGTSLVAVSSAQEWMIGDWITWGSGEEDTIRNWIIRVSGLEWMIGARVIQAVGGGATVPIGMAIATRALPLHQRGLALGIVAGAAEAGSMLGPAYGGAIIELSNWRWIFWLNVPQSAVLFLALFWLPNQRSAQGRVDYMGGALLIAALLVLSLALSREGLFTLSSPDPFILGAVGVGLVAALVVLERRTLQPLLAPVLFRSRAFLAARR